jgi:hypothetical protein
VSGVAVAGIYVFTTGDRLCAGCPGETPLGIVLSMGPGTGTCATGDGTPPSDCAYVFSVYVSETNGTPGPLTPQDLAFQVQNGSGDAVALAFGVTVVSPEGCGLASWDSATGSWGDATAPGECSGGSASVAIPNNGTFVLTPIPRGGLPFSQGGERLLAEGIGPTYTGTVSAGIG